MLPNIAEWGKGIEKKKKKNAGMSGLSLISLLVVDKCYLTVSPPVCQA